jgi:SAM-dependent methyltransferase
VDKFQIQDDEYSFPYHHIPNLDSEGRISLSRSAKWGFGYLCTLTHVRELILSNKPSSLLDVGCGDGRFTGMISEDIDRCLGVDLSERAISIAKALRPEIDFRATNVAAIEEGFDVVVAIETLEHVPDSGISAFVQALESRLNPGGRLVITVPSTNHPMQPKHYRHYDASLLQNQVEQSSQNLKLESIEYINRIYFPMRILLALHYNKLWVAEVKPLLQLYWKFYLNKMRQADSDDGTNVVGVFRCPSAE